MQDTSTIAINDQNRGGLFSPDDEAEAMGWDRSEPYPRFLALLEEGKPVREGGLDQLMGLPPQLRQEELRGRKHYTFLSFDAVNKAFMDSERFTNHVYDYLSKPALGDTLLNMDGARHRRVRNVAKPFFKPSFAETWWNDKWIVQAVDELFDRITLKDHADLNMELCAPLPMSVISAGFGIPQEEFLNFRIALTDIMTSGHNDPAKAEAGGRVVQAVLGRAFEERRGDPRDDLITKLVHADFEDDDGTVRKLTDDEVMRYCNLIVFAGGGTTWRQLGITIKALMDNPDQMEALRADRSLLRQTIQESARWYPTDPHFLRWIAQDTEIEGVTIEAGSIAWLCVSTANRDRTQWDDPDRFDIHRPVKRNFAFGAGNHACLGQHLSRQEMEVALNAVLDRLPGLRWDPEKPSSTITGGTLMQRGPDALHVRFTPGH
ncbi:cytochrome P450 [Novosphingobium pentaromativorans]|uniref:Cytochrome P450 n=1 Tax=Novosphingobium pentaromativorans US6-1 TaxID=1088721 RepID=G6ED40_9SPHN|nr:cytochrome P450 [Novosphingobium pentaromativorans]AIT79857.1 hypothetical protein JI59_08775 [Novosphingobium pentaromativorans US6-1]EHJ60752.1 hypothetical protein NSU_2261 [Novosphingobium pentaromativorans US6-1]